jgi:uncharacterized membrane protein YraQ (UPF0718 family)
MMTTERRKLTEPLGSVTVIFGGLLLAFTVIGVILALTGSGSLWGFGHAAICATQPGTYGSSDWATTSLGVTARPGASIAVNGALQACAAHPGTGQRALYTLTSLPGWLVWGCVLFLLWRVISAARRTGPFTAQAAAAMRRLGWLIIAGSVVAALIQGFALDELLNTMLVPRASFYNLITAPLYALLPVPALAGAALLTFARFVRLGADMDDEIQGTV